MSTKTRTLTLFLAITCAAILSATASDQTKTNEVKTVSKAKAKKVQGDRKGGGVLLTGSYIKQDVRRTGRITDGANQVIVLDRDMIERSGASDVRQLLTHQGIH